MVTTSNDGFFAVGSDTFTQACALGIYPAATFLVLARGSGADNVTTSWSAQATAKRLAVRWPKAREAIERLGDAGIVRKTGKVKRNPSYKLRKDGDLIWLPNALVDGVAGTTPPVARIRQTNDPMVLQLLVDLYGAQNLREDGGISTSVICGNYERQRLGQLGVFVVWGFERQSHTVMWKTAASERHYRPKDQLTEAELAEGKNPAVDFFRRFEHLASLGLVAEVPTLFDGPDGEPVHPIYELSDIPLERTLAVACTGAARRALSDEHHDIFDHRGWPSIVALAPAHIEQAAVIGIYRLRFRPHTRLNAAWWGNLNDRAAEYITQYDQVNPDADWRAA